MEELVLIALFAILAGLFKGISGFGSSLVTIPLLSWLWGAERIDEIIVMMITFNVVLNLLLLTENKGFSIKSLKGVYPITITGVLFTFVGLTLLTSVDPKLISLLAAILIVLAVVIKTYGIFAPDKIHFEPNIPTQIVVGALSGIGNGIASVDGPPVVFYLTATKAKKSVFKNTLATHFLIMGIMGVIFMILGSYYTQDILLNTTYFAIFSSLGVVAGIQISKRINEETFSIAILVSLVLLAGRMIFVYFTN